MKRKIKRTEQKQEWSGGGLPLIEDGRVEIILRKKEKEILVTGVLRILEYGDTRMLFAIKGGHLLVEGQSLDCATYQSGALSIVGRVDTLSFEEGMG